MAIPARATPPFVVPCLEHTWRLSREGVGGVWTGSLRLGPVRSPRTRCFRPGALAVAWP